LKSDAPVLEAIENTGDDVETDWRLNMPWIVDVPTDMTPFARTLRLEVPRFIDPAAFIVKIFWFVELATRRIIPVDDVALTTSDAFGVVVPIPTKSLRVDIVVEPFPELSPTIPMIVESLVPFQ
jgi:hypothetical protein